MEGSGYPAEEAGGEQEGRTSIINEKLPPPREILELSEKQLERLLKMQEPVNELLQVMTATPEEAQRREELAERVLEVTGQQSGIATELEELVRMWTERERRVREAVERHVRRQEAYLDQEGGR